MGDALYSFPLYCVTVSYLIPSYQLDALSYFTQFRNAKHPIFQICGCNNRAHFSVLICCSLLNALYIRSKRVKTAELKESREQTYSLL